MPSVPFAIVTPWWSDTSAGGAEFLARDLASQLHRRGFRVEVLTTCGRDAFSSWSEDHFAPGTTDEDGPVVRRFSLGQRNEQLFAQLYRALAEGQFLSPTQEREFVANSINSPSLVRFIEEHRTEYCFCFIPYLYGTTYWGVLAAGDRAILIPCLHNEPIAYLEPFQQMMKSVRGFWFLSEAEHCFARALYPIQRAAARVVGAGMDFCGRGDGDAFRKRFGLDGPYIVFAGRRVPGKGFGLLLRLFARFSERHTEWTLVLAGLGAETDAEQPPPRVVDLGPIDKQTLWDAMAGATAFCQPSRYESFSYVLMEAWTQGAPALVNANCEVLRRQCEVAGGGLWFADEDEFEAALLYFQRHPDEARQMGQQGVDYVARNFRWDDVIARAVELFAACGFSVSAPSPRG
ncbi:glycosyltransferase family 4 protein [Candidatus Sumerlaeota bacterium]|nr:glycosyltransferase family 4 protein [Candidatus Sumerlaeota bacterium]